MQKTAKKMLQLTLICSVFLMGAQPVLAKNEDNDLDELTVQLGNEWRIVKDDKRRAIKSYAKLENDKRFRSFKVEAVMNTSIDVIGRVLFDFDNYYKWYWQVKDIKLLKKVSETEHYLYLAHHAPPTIPDRDVILHTVIEPYSSNHPYVIFKVKAAPNYIPVKPPLIRMLAEDMLLKMTPIGQNKVRLEAEGYVDPNGKEPVWATNFIQRSAPYSIIKGLQYMTTLEEYQKPASNPEFTLRVN
ncbi:hypothetical protein [Agitococcus lubricus]|uniref:START domain-containing protein n=1 Tax=Agitococcus lubricus TaxID=1077255 RepID=A0A2T5IZP8_9GAMM|nr:hypothetical protein [Agitococcus lubricus]PTQ89515.1 hypothetical protein C8N29_10646 [Agitococcus lubricus]